MANVIPPWERDVTRGGATVVFEHSKNGIDLAAANLDDHFYTATTHTSQKPGSLPGSTYSSSSTIHCPCCPQHKNSQTKSKSTVFKPDTTAPSPRVTVRELASKHSRSKLRKPSVLQAPPTPFLDCDLSSAELDVLWMLPGIYDAYNEEVARAEAGEEDLEKKAFYLSKLRVKLRERLRELIESSKEGIKHMWNHNDEQDPWRDSWYS